MSRVVELLCSRRVAARRGAGADVHWVCRLQRRHADAACRKTTLLQSLCLATGNHRLGTGRPQVERRELPQYSRPQSQYQSSRCRRRSRPRSPIRPPQPACPGEGAALSSYAPPAHQPLETTATVAPRSVAADPRAGASASRHHDHRRHQRHARNAVAPLQRFVRRDPAGQWLQGTARAVARPATDHSAPDRGRRSPAPAPAVAAWPASRCARRVERSCRQSRRHVAQHRAPQSTCRWRISPRPTISILGQAQARHEAHRARREDRAAAPVAQPAPLPPRSRSPHWRRPRPVGRGAPAPPQSARLAQATTQGRGSAAAEAPVKASEATGALPTFRWPVRGKVITSYGAKTNGKSNDGINWRCPKARR